MATAVSINDLRKTFTPRRGSPVEAVRGLDLQIERGEVVALLGPNGAGKTTTVDMVLGLTSPTSGQVRVFDGDPRRAVLDGRVSAVLQTGGLLRDLTVRETVEVIASTFKAKERIPAVMERTGLARLADRRVSKCSGGEQQRLRFALALLPDPDLLVLDEPTAGMDVAARRDFWGVMHEEARAGRTVVFATHYLQEAEDFADRTVLMAAGRVVADGPTEEVRSQVGGRVITARLAAEEVDGLVRRLHDLPQTQGAEVVHDHGRVRIQAADADAVARVLILDTGASDLEITRPSLDDAFVALTSPDQEATR